MLDVTCARRSSCVWLLVHSRHLQGLRVVDASVMPSACALALSACLQPLTVSLATGITNGNIYAPTMMIAEKAADLVLGNTPLQPQRSQFYRRQTRAAAGGGRRVSTKDE